MSVGIAGELVRVANGVAWGVHRKLTGVHSHNSRRGSEICSLGAYVRVQYTTRDAAFTMTIRARTAHLAIDLLLGAPLHIKYSHATSGPSNISNSTMLDRKQDDFQITGETHCDWNRGWQASLPVDDTAYLV